FVAGLEARARVPVVTIRVRVAGLRRVARGLPGAHAVPAHVAGRAETPVVARRPVRPLGRHAALATAQGVAAFPPLAVEVVAEKAGVAHRVVAALPGLRVAIGAAGIPAGAGEGPVHADALADGVHGARIAVVAVCVGDPRRRHAGLVAGVAGAGAVTASARARMVGDLARAVRRSRGELTAPARQVT